jgi:hypothetical protein
MSFTFSLCDAVRRLLEVLLQADAMTPLERCRERSERLQGQHSSTSLSRFCRSKKAGRTVLLPRVISFFFSFKKQVAVSSYLEMMHSLCPIREEPKDWRLWCVSFITAFFSPFFHRPQKSIYTYRNRRSQSVRLGGRRRSSGSCNMDGSKLWIHLLVQAEVHTVVVGFCTSKFDYTPKIIHPF